MNSTTHPSMPSIARSNPIADCIRAAAKSHTLDADTLLNEVEAAILTVKQPGLSKRDQKRWADDCVRVLAYIYEHNTGRRVGFTNGEAETRFERFVRLVVVDEDREISRNLIKAAIRRFNHTETRGPTIGIAAE
jgi:hypothetical protein